MTTTLGTVLRAESVTASIIGDLWKACDDRIPVRFIRNDYLDTRTVPTFPNDTCEHVNGQPPCGSTCTVFAHDNILRQYDTIVVNSGAHVRDLDEYAIEMRKSSYVIAERMRRLHGEDALMVFRNTVPGHANCTERRFGDPVNESLALELVVGDKQKGYKWEMFAKMNQLVEGAFRSNGWEILDAYTPTLLRADSHIGGKDCLHYCIPGPADHWIVLLYNILAERESSSTYPLN